MLAALSTIFFFLAAAVAIATIVLSLADNAAAIRTALGFGEPVRAGLGYAARVRRTSRPYRQARPVPLRIRAAA